MELRFSVLWIIVLLISSHMGWISNDTFTICLILLVIATHFYENKT